MANGDDSFGYGMVAVGVGLLWIGKNLYSHPLESAEAAQRWPISERAPRWARSSPEANRAMLRPLGFVFLIAGAGLVIGGIWVIAVV